jgi:antitoxin component of MazEF toxin-antitoxin module
MTEVFEAKLRRIGNSVGVIIPAEIIEELGFEIGDVVHIALPPSSKEKRNKEIMKLAGIYRKASPFKRDKRDRF